nr:unnamed protein product [Digitaria exilis]
MFKDETIKSAQVKVEVHYNSSSSPPRSPEAAFGKTDAQATYRETWCCDCRARNVLFGSQIDLCRDSTKSGKAAASDAGQARLQKAVTGGGAQGLAPPVFASWTTAPAERKNTLQFFLLSQLNTPSSPWESAARLPAVARQRHPTLGRRDYKRRRAGGRAAERGAGLSAAGVRLLDDGTSRAQDLPSDLLGRILQLLELPEALSVACWCPAFTYPMANVLV